MTFIMALGEILDEVDQSVPGTGALGDSNLVVMSETALERKDAGNRKNSFGRFDCRPVISMAGTISQRL